MSILCGFDLLLALLQVHGFSATLFTLSQASFSVPAVAHE